jgi:hypothetical protein
MSSARSVEGYFKTGTFQDGTVLVKDVFGTTTEDLTTGTSSYADMPTRKSGVSSW